MDELESFITEFSSNNSCLKNDFERFSRLKHVLISIFKLIIPDRDEDLTLDNLLSKCDANQVPLWDSLEFLVKPELKKLYSKIFSICNNFNQKIKHYCLNQDKISNIFFNSELMESGTFIGSVNDNQTNMIKFEGNESQIKDTCDKDVNVDFFDYNEMIEFVENAEASNEDTKSFSSNSNSSDSECNGKNLKYNDFFSRNNSEARNEAGFRIENLKQKLGPFESHEQLNENVLIKPLPQSSEIQLNDSEFTDDLNELCELDKTSKSKLAGEQKKISKLIDELEEDIIKEKEWYNLGESSVMNRSKNSLLDLHLEIPQFSNSNNQEVCQAYTSMYDNNQKYQSDTQNDLNSYIESIVKQRIIDNVFDEVSSFELKTTGAEDDTPDIQVEKSKLSLSEIYSKKYEEQVIGNKVDEESLGQKEALAERLSSIMKKLDSLSNQFFTSGLPAVVNCARNDVPTLKLEDTIPIIISDHTRTAPHELKKQGRFVSDCEFTRLEKRSRRGRNKMKNKENKDSKGRGFTDIMKISSSETKNKKRAIKENSTELPDKRIKSHHFKLGS